MQLMKWIWIPKIFICLFIGPAGHADTWMVHQKNIRSYEKKIHTHKEEIKAAIEKKKNASGPDELQEITKNMVTSHKSMTEQIAKRAKELKHMRFRHPEKGQDFERKYYKTYRVKTLAEFEGEDSLAGQLTNIHKKLKKQYNFQTEEDLLRGPSSRDADDSFKESLMLVK